jgi:hypothetical protein
MPLQNSGVPLTISYKALNYPEANERIRGWKTWPAGHFGPVRPQPESGYPLTVEGKWAEIGRWMLDILTL